ncbi:MAG: EAL domain-containing protein, partial [Hungatella sp.]
ELCEVVDSIEIDRKYIEVEITETAIYENMDALEALLIELHANGFAMSMDDFGSGYSSLGLLKNLPVDTIKMDRSFFANQKDTVRSKIVVGSIIEMAAGLGIHIVAEGVEEQQYIDLLRGLHCDMVQGYYYSRPMSVEDFTELIRKPVGFSSARSSYFV